MSSNALVSQGMVIKISDAASPEVYTTIAEVTSISGPGGSSTEIDVTDLSSTAKEKRLGLKDNGSINLAMNFIPGNTQHALLRTLSESGAARNFHLLFTDSPQTQWAFSAYVQELSIDNSVDSVTTASVVLLLSGAITES